MVKRSPFLDIKPKTNVVRKARTGTTATVTEILENGRVEVMFGEGEDAEYATCRASGGVTAVGSQVAVRIDPVTGKLVSVADPIRIPEGSDLVSTGVTGETILQTRDVAGEVAEAQEKLDADMEDLAADLADANKAIDDAGELIETVVKPGLEAAQGDADKAAQDAALAMVTAQGIIKAGPDDPGHEKGRLWIQTKDGLPVGMKISDGENWVPYALFAEDIFVVGEDGTVHIRDGVIKTPMLEVTADLWTAMLEVAGDATIGGNLIGLNTITAPNIVASEELSAKIGRFLEVSTDMLLAGGAKITGEVLADVIRLATKIVCGDENNGVTIDRSGVHVYKDGTETVRLSALGNGLRIFNESMGRMVDLSPSAFGSWSYYSSAKWLMKKATQNSPWNDPKPGPWRRIDLGTWTAPTSRVKCWSSFRSGAVNTSLNYGGQGQFILRPNSNTSTSGQIIMTDTGGLYYDYQLSIGTKVEISRAEVTEGQQYHVVFLGRTILLDNPAYTPVFGNLTCILDPA